jgi:hypothetical protein
MRITIVDTERVNELRYRISYEQEDHHFFGAYFKTSEEMIRGLARILKVDLQSQEPEFKPFFLQEQNAYQPENGDAVTGNR